MAEDQIESIIEYQDDIADAQPPTPLPVGKYHASVIGALIKTSQKGNQYCEVMFRIPSEQYPPDYLDGNPEGTNIAFRRLSPTGTALARYGMRRFCEAIGAPLGRKLDMSDWIGKEATLDIVHRDYEGSPRMDIKAVEKA